MLIAATPALPDPPNSTPVGVPTAPGPTRCIQQLTWTPIVVVLEPGVSKRIVTMALPLLCPSAPTVRDVNRAPAPQQAHSEHVATSYPGSASAKGETEAGPLSTAVVTHEGGNRDARPHAAMQITSSPGKSVVHGPTRDAANVMVVKRDAEDTQQRSKSCGEEVESTPRLPPADPRPAHTQAMVSLDGSRCIVIIDMCADVSLASARMLRPGVKYVPWSERDGGITGVALQGIAILGCAVLEVHLGQVRALTPFVVALGVGFDATLGADFFYGHGISVTLSQHWLVFKAHDGLIVPLVGHHPRFKHSCALAHDVALCPGGRALVRFACDRPGRGIGPSRTPEVSFIAERKNRKLGFMVSEQLTTGLLEIQSTADHPLYLPAGWEVTKVQDCHFVPRGPPRLVSGQRRVAINVVSASGAGESLATPSDKAQGSTAADTTPGPWEVGGQQLDRSGDSRSDRTATGEMLEDTPRNREMHCAERARTPDRDVRQPRPRLVSPDPDRTPVPAAKSVKPYQITEDKHPIPRLPSPNSCLTLEEPSELRNLLHEFRDRFNGGTRPLLATNLLKARLDTGNTPPISFPPRRLSPAMREVGRSAVAELDAKGITEPGIGQWGSPVVMMKKASGAWRRRCDYREVNKHVMIPQQPLPRTDDILASLKGKRYFSVMDMCHGFYQIEIEEENRPKTSFVTPDCQRQYRRLPFGFASSPAIFQRMLDVLLSGMKWVFAIGYIDEIIMCSDTWADHLAHLRRLFEALRKANLELHPGKCAFGAQEVKYLGQVVTRDGIRACTSKINVEMPRPASAKEAQRFIGKCQ